MEIDFSMAFPRNLADRVNATKVVIMVTLMMSQMSIAICQTTLPFVEASLPLHGQDHILLMRGIQSLSNTVVIIALASHQC
jgi:hypothetical protein